MKKQTRVYVKRTPKYWLFRKVNKYSMKVWYLIVILMGMVLTYALISWIVNREPLISPLVLNPVKEVQAKEPEVVIPCSEDVISYLRCKFYSGELTEREARTLIAIGKAESGLRETAKNKRSTASGVFQIVAPTWYLYRCTGDVLNWKDNTDCAIKIMDKSGFSPWEAYNKGSYLKFMNVEI